MAYRWRSGRKGRPHLRRRTQPGEDDNDRSDDVREDDADSAQDVPAHHLAVHRSPGLRAALRNKHGLDEHRQQ